MLRRKNIYISRKSAFNNSILSSCIDVKKNSDISNSKVGLATYIGSDCQMTYTSIGKFCSVGNNVKIVSNNHPIKDYISTHPAFHRPNHPLMKKVGLDFDCEEEYPEYNNLYHENYRTLIGNDVWIGTNVTIIEGVSIGDGAVLACGSVVTKDVEPFSITGGVPARHIKYRFSLKERESIQLSKWWDWDFERIKDSSSCFNNIDKFLRLL